jgi:CHASE3 domain sensor protein
MTKLETALSLEQILEGMRQLSDDEKRALASIILLDPSFEAFVEEVDDTLACERAATEGPPEPFSPDELTKHEL